MLLANPFGWELRPVLKRRAELEAALGMPIGRQLGCGKFGCVFESTSPWVVKLTADPTEGPIWVKMLQAVRAHGQQAGLCRVKDVLRVHPIPRSPEEPKEFLFEGRPIKIYAVIREAAYPLLSDDGFSQTTLKRTGVPNDWHDLNLHDWKPRTAQQRDLHEALFGLSIYRDSAHHWHSTKDEVRRLRVSGDLLRGIKQMQESLVGRAIGDTLAMLYDQQDLVLKDVHENNIGWRVHPEIEGDVQPDTLMIYDPGHTPAGRQKVARIYLPNG